MGWWDDGSAFLTAVCIAQGSLCVSPGPLRAGCCDSYHRGLPPRLNVCVVGLTMSILKEGVGRWGAGEDGGGLYPTCL